MAVPIPTRELPVAIPIFVVPSFTLIKELN
jgi:hypothetical protein